MTIEKSHTMAGMYNCFTRIDGVLYVGAGRSHSEATNDMFEKLRWNNIGRWTLGHDSEAEIDGSYEPAQERNLPDGYHSRDLE